MGRDKEGQRVAVVGDRLQSRISTGSLAVHTPFTQVRQTRCWEQFLCPRRAQEHAAGDNKRCQSRRAGSPLESAAQDNLSSRQRGVKGLNTAQPPQPAVALVICSMAAGLHGA